MGGRAAGTSGETAGGSEGRESGVEERKMAWVTFGEVAVMPSHFHFYLYILYPTSRKTNGICSASERVMESAKYI